MKIRLHIIWITLVLLLVSSCQIKPTEIRYGEDHCKYCDMTIVDKSHAAEYVTSKGKPQVFDAIECLVMDIKENGTDLDLHFTLVADYGNPGVLIDAHSALYLISKNVKSPMGGNLSAFSSKALAEETLAQHGGLLISWDELKERYAN